MCLLTYTLKNKNNLLYRNIATNKYGNIITNIGIKIIYIFEILEKYLKNWVSVERFKDNMAKKIRKTGEGK